MKTEAFFLLLFLPHVIIGQIDLIHADTPQIFMPGIVSTEHLEHSSPSIDTTNHSICWSMWEKSKPAHPRQIIKIYHYKTAAILQEVGFSNQYSDGGPVWMNENKILFYSKRPVDPSHPDELINDLWICERVNDKWEEPYCLKFSEHTRFAVSPSIAKSGNIYFLGYADSVENNMGIYLAQWSEGGYETPQLLPPQINSKYFDWTPFIAYDESYLIFSSNRPGSKDPYGDLFISFRDTNGQWMNPASLGDKVNTDRQERFPGVSPDEKILFFTRATDESEDDIYWVDAKIVAEIKEGVFSQE